MTYAATIHELFLPAVDAHSFFEKEASIAKMPDDEKKWPSHVISELHRQLPFLSGYQVDLSLQRIEPEAGFAFGYASIRNRMDTDARQEMTNEENLLRIPIMVGDRQLKPFHVFEVGGESYPLTQERVEAAMLNPAMFDGPAEQPKKNKSLVDQMYPPYQQRQGFGRVVSPGGLGINKLSSVETEKEAGAARKEKFERGRGTSAAAAALGSFGVPVVLPGGAAALGADPKRRWRAAAGASVGQLAGLGLALKGGEGRLGDASILALPAATALGAYLAHGKKEANMPAPAAFSPAGALKPDTLRRVAKLKETRRTDDIKGQLSFKDKVKDTAGRAVLPAAVGAATGGWAKRTLRGAGKGALLGGALTAASAVGGEALRKRREMDRRTMGLKEAMAKMEKEALAMLNFDKARRMPATMILQKTKGFPTLRTGVMPQSIGFYAVPGSQFVIGVHSSAEKPLNATKDQKQLRRILSGLMKQELRAKIAKRRSPGVFLLLQRVKGGYIYHPPKRLPGMGM